MKTLYRRMLLLYTIFLVTLLTALGFVLGQFFSLFNYSISPQDERQYLTFLVIVLIAGCILSIFMAAHILRRYTEPIDQLTDIAKKIAKGDELRTIPDFEYYDSNELSSAISKIAHDLEEMSTLRTMEKERLNTLIESMGSGLLMLGRGGNINLVNGSFLHTFGFANKQIIGENTNNIALPKEIQKLIETVFLTEKPNEIQVHLTTSKEPVSIVVYAAPVIGTYGNWLGIVVVVHDISELIRLERFRKDFVANVSHELRTPVTSIKGFTETLLDGAIHDETVRNEFLAIIQKESNRLQLLIDDLLVLSGVEREGFTLKIGIVSIKEMIEDALRAVSQRVAEKRMNVIFQMDEPIQIEGDTDRLMQVMVNLLSNAVSYSQEEKTITVQVKKDHHSVEISIQDEGVGIAQSELPRLFERFYRVDRARSRESGGTGLGLAIVKHLVEAHHGSVAVESVEQVGTTFKVKLPIAQHIQ